MLIDKVTSDSLSTQLRCVDLYIDTNTGKIISGQDFFYNVKDLPCEIVDCDGDILSPGLIDVQINGAYGFDFSLWPPLNTEHLSRAQQVDVYLAGLDRVASKIVETGTTSFLPTIITQQQDLYREVCGELTNLLV